MEQNKIKIDLNQGLFEAEGSEDFINSYYKQFEIIVQHKTIAKKINKAPVNPIKKVRKNINKKPIVNKELNLKPNNKKHLKDFYNEKNPTTNIQRNVIFVFYLEKELEKKEIDLSDIYTCYIEAGARVGDLFSSIKDTAGKSYGYLDINNIKDIKLSIHGENLILHDLPTKSQK